MIDVLIGWWVAELVGDRHEIDWRQAEFAMCQTTRRWVVAMVHRRAVGMKELKQQFRYDFQRRATYREVTKKLHVAADRRWSLRSNLTRGRYLHRRQTGAFIYIPYLLPPKKSHGQKAKWAKTNHDVGSTMAAAVAPYYDHLPIELRP